MQDPYPFYRRARASGDFFFWDDYGLPMAVTHEAVNLVLKDKRLGRALPAGKERDIPAGLEDFYAVEAHSMLELEAPDHTRLRRLVLRAFTKGRIMRLAPEISAICDGLIDAFPESEAFDLLDRFAQKLPVIVIARLLGVPEDMAPQLLAWSNAMVAMYQAGRTPEMETAANTAAAEFSDYLDRYIEKRRNAPGSDLLSELIAAESDGERLSREELISTCILLLNAGHEATVHSIGNAVRHLSGFKGRRIALDPERIEGTVEECLRFDPPLHMFTRYVYEPVTFLDHDFKPGDQIGCLLASACRDDAVWPDADVFDPFRAIRTNTAFGAGIHFCVGAPLARLEMQIALPILYSRCPALEIVEPPKVADLYHFRGLERLIVRV